MATIELSSAETEVLRDVLEVYLSGLRVEISRTDHREFRTMLQQRYQLMEGVLLRLGGEIAPRAQARH